MARKIIKWILIAVAVACAAIIAIVLLGKSPPPRPLPNPNGYDDFVKAGQLATPISYPKDYRTMSREELASVISTNAEALKLVRTGLSHECRVPGDYSPDYMARRLVPGLSELKSLVFLKCAEGRLAELEGRTNDAIKIYLDGLRFGQESSRGGVIVHKLVGLGCETISLEPLDPLVHAVDASQARKVAQAIETIDASEPPVKEVLDAEKRWAHKALGLRDQFMALLDHKGLKQSQDQVIQRMKDTALHRRETMVAFAARAYELEHGKRPQSLADLVPTYLKTIPRDPTTGANLVYSP